MQQENSNHGRDQNIINQPRNVFINPQPEKQRDATQQKLLDVVQEEVRDRLDQSLHRVVNAALINLGKESQPDRVRSPWQMEMRSKARSPHLLPPETTIQQVFDAAEIDRTLLILGEPGSGKTTTMLELAKSLVERAQASATQPVPLLLDLSSWKPDPKAKPQEADPFLNWLLSQIKRKYMGLNPKLSREWLAANELLLLLDGLDEVKPEHQQACAKAINDWLMRDLEHRPAGLVVCCRIEEYEAVVRHRLYLNKAIALQPLTESQIANYLHQFELASVWQSVQASDSLQAILQKPLFLSVFGFVASEGLFDDAAWQQRTTEAAQQEYLWDQYWEVAMQRELVTAREREQGLKSKTYRTKEPPSRKVLRRALVFAAKALEKEFETELLIEWIQPYWLITRWQQRQYRMTFSLIFWLVFWLTLGFILGLTFGLIPGLIFGFSIGLFWGSTFCLMFEIAFGKDWKNANIYPVDKIQISRLYNLWQQSLRLLGDRLLFGLIFGLIIGLFLWSSFPASAVEILGSTRRLTYSLMAGLTFGLTFGLVSAIISGATTSDKIRIEPNQGIRNSLQNMLILFSLSLVSALFLKGLLERLLTKFIHPDLALPAITVFLFTFVWTSLDQGGARSLFRHVALRLVMWRYGYVPLRYDRLLDYATDRLLLQRIGGRYRFMHKLLQEHFAAMPFEE